MARVFSVRVGHDNIAVNGPDIIFDKAIVNVAADRLDDKGIWPHINLLKASAG